MFRFADAGMNAKSYCRLTTDAPSPRNPREYPHTLYF